MRSALIALRVSGVAVALAALTAVSAPTALAAGEDNRGSVSVDPHRAEPGAQVKLRVRGCDGTSGSAKSSVFVAEVHLSSGRDGERSLWGDAMISSHAQPGRHDIRVRCDGDDDRVRGSIEVVRHREDQDRDRDRDRDRPNPHQSPVWPVHAGGGGMAAELARTARVAQAADQGQDQGQDQARDQAATAKKSHGPDGPGLPHTVIGAVLAAAATLAVAGRALALRRRRSGE